MQMGPPLQSQDAIPPAQETDTSPLQLGHALLQAGSVDALRGGRANLPWGGVQGPLVPELLRFGD